MWLNKPHGPSVFRNLPCLLSLFLDRLLWHTAERARASHTHLGTQPACGSWAPGGLTEYCKQTRNVELPLGWCWGGGEDSTQRLQGSVNIVDSREAMFPTQTAGWRAIRQKKIDGLAKEDARGTTGHHRRGFLGASE